MTPGDLQQMLYCLPAGMMIGCFHFGGLWLTIHWFAGTRYWGLIFVAGFVLRSLVTLTAVFMVANGEWIGMTACLAGIWIMRKIFVFTLQPGAVGGTKGSPS
jgi:F1F0 ATPase subunit 2